MTKLKECPFCGSLPEVLESFVTYEVRCQECGGRTVSFVKNDAIANWNRRDHKNEIQEKTYSD